MISLGIFVCVGGCCGWVYCRLVNFEKTSCTGVEGGEFSGLSRVHGTYAADTRQYHNYKLSSSQQQRGVWDKAPGPRLCRTPRGVAWRPAPPPGRGEAISPRSCHGGTERPCVGAGVLQGPGPPGEAGVERGLRPGSWAKSQRPRN